jgi:hypothetical protein
MANAPPRASRTEPRRGVALVSAVTPCYKQPHLHRQRMESMSPRPDRILISLWWTTVQRTTPWGLPPTIRSVLPPGETGACPGLYARLWQSKGDCLVFLPSMTGCPSCF